MTAVVGCILATTSTATPVTLEQTIVRAADLAEIAGTYERFRANSELLRAEHALLTGTQLSFADWAHLTTRVLARYMSEDIRLTSRHDGPGGVSEFHRRALSNVARYLAEAPQVST